jgi:FlaA1/EpsC-like NDP-sugar epimerase
MCLYFMTIPEATQLVLQAGAMGGTGEIFLLDMGEPVKIVDLARDLIELSGLRPDIDISIEYTGLRPGEKLVEELLTAEEGCDRTAHPKIMVGRVGSPKMELLQHQLERLHAAAQANDARGIRYALGEIIPESRLAAAGRDNEPAVGSYGEETMPEEADKSVRRAKGAA